MPDEYYNFQHYCYFLALWLFLLRLQFILLIKPILLCRNCNQWHEKNWNSTCVHTILTGPWPMRDVSTLSPLHLRQGNRCYGCAHPAALHPADCFPLLEPDIHGNCSHNNHYTETDGWPDDSCHAYERDTGVLPVGIRGILSPWTTAEAFQRACLEVKSRPWYQWEWPWDLPLRTWYSW